MSKKNETALAVEDGLKTQLKKNGTYGRYYNDLIMDYMAFWAIKSTLQADIAERGAKVAKLDSRGQGQIVNNESIDQLLKVNAQMLKILENLGIKPVEGESVEDGDEDDL